MKSLICILACLCIAGPLSATVVIDEFDRTNADATVYGTYYSNVFFESVDTSYLDTGLDSTRVIGGSRQIDVNFSVQGSISNNFNISDGVVYPDWMQEYAALSLGSGALADLTLRYDNEGNGLGINLLGGDSTKFVLDYDPDHVGHLRKTIIKMTVEDASGQTAEVSYEYTVYANPPRTDLDFLFSDFQANNANIDLTDVDAITFFYQSDNANDVAFYSIATDGTIPEPATIGLLGIGALSLLKRRRA